MSDQKNSKQAQDSDENFVIAQRREKLAALRALGQSYPNDFRPDATAECLHGLYGELDDEGLEQQAHRHAVAGRIMAKRVMGKASFISVQDSSGRIQAFLQRDTVGEDCYKAFKGWDVGDIVGLEGTMFRTKAGELTIKAETIRLLVKSLRPLPEKWAGLTDVEQRYRQRYVDLTMNAGARETFRRRTRLLRFMRDFFDALDFIEVETPMLQPIPGGAAAKPFVTHYHALGRDMYLRIAPELYLKRLVVGGFERVYEINRNFRNEGLSTRHNPEFTMLEFYQAHSDYRDVMERIEHLVRDAALAVLGDTTVHYQGTDYDLSQPFTRMSMREAVLAYNPDLDPAVLDDRARLAEVTRAAGGDVKDSYGWGKLLTELFEKTVEHRLSAPTFITAYPAEVSPLARRNDNNPEVTDRFEFFLAGREVANGFSELNDPDDQAERFRAQVAAKDAGDDEAMVYDADYIRALEYGMPPTAGAGIGVDRLAMFFTDSASIRDVLLFPQMRPEQ